MADEPPPQHSSPSVSTVAVGARARQVNPTFAETKPPTASAVDQILTKGDPVYFSDAPNDGVKLTASNSDLVGKITTAEAIMQEDQDVLRILAK